MNLEIDLQYRTTAWSVCSRKDIDKLDLVVIFCDSEIQAQGRGKQASPSATVTVSLSEYTNELFER